MWWPEGGRTTVQPLVTPYSIGREEPVARDIRFCATNATLPPALLGDATWYGTLSAVRNLGAHGVPVTLASDSRLAPARFSRFVRRTVPCPATQDASRYLDWLRAFGEREPGHVLYPTSDEAAWHVSAHREELSRWFLLYSPPLDSLVRVLDKLQLATVARAAGLDVPESWCPEDEAAVARLGRELAFPVFVKPRAQVLSSRNGKGMRAESREALVASWRAWRDGSRYPREIRDRIQGVDLPVIQACHPGSERIYTVDGFIDRSGELFGALACVKLLQRPRASGPGILFEDAPLAPDLEEGLRRLCTATGFHGVFDAEFLEHRGRKLLIDFNPRFYNHMAFEVDRGLPLPWLAYLAALGDDAALRGAVLQARAARTERRVFVHRVSTELMLLVQALSGAMSRDERRRWRRWIAEHDGRITDPARSDDDRRPAVAAIALEMVGFARHPRSFLRHLARGGTPTGTTCRAPTRPVAR